MKRVLANLLVVLSSLVFALAAVAWARSFWVEDRIVCYDKRGGGRINDDVFNRRGGPADDATPTADESLLVVARGGIRGWVRHEEWYRVVGAIFPGHWSELQRITPPGPYPVYVPAYPSKPPQVERTAVAGFEVVRTVESPGSFPTYVEQTTSVTVPLVAVALPAGVPPACWLRRWWRRRRARSAQAGGFPVGTGGGSQKFGAAARVDWGAERGRGRRSST